MRNKEILSNQLQAILIEYRAVKAQAKYEDLSGNVPEEKVAELLTRSRTAIVRISGASSEYYKDYNSIAESNMHPGARLIRIAGIIQALKSDVDNDFLQSFSQLIHSEVFSDYIEMSSHLLSEGYKDPAAVIAGSTLESHLRELCKNRNIPLTLINNANKLIPKKADTLNAELAKSGSYSTAFQKSITAWLDLRNKAAHGHYAEYKMEEVKLMIAGIQNFMLTVHA